MAAPTTYTYDEFADYLQREVLREAASTLGWADSVPFQSKVVNVLRFRDNGTGAMASGTFTVEQSPMRLFIGDNITLSNGVVYQVTTPSGGSGITIGDQPLPAGLDIGGIRVTMNKISGTGNWSNSIVYERVVKNEVARVRNPKFNAVTDEVLNQLGLTNISQVNSVVGALLFRTAGRVEILRRSMQGMAADYNYFSEGNTTNTRSQIYQQTSRLFQYEERRLRELIRRINYVPPTLKMPDEALSSSMTTTPTW